MDPADAIPAFDAFLAVRGVLFEAVIIGGSALVLLGVVQRTTDDCDVLDPNIPEAVQVAARESWLPLARKQLARLGKELGYDAVF